MAQVQSPAAKRAALKQLSKAIFQPLEELSYVEAGFLFRSHLDDFMSGVHFLIEVVDGLSAIQQTNLATAADANQVHPELKPTLRRLCELSREVTFANDPGRLPVSLRVSIEKLFQFAVDQVPPVADEEARDYLANISERTLQPIAIV